MVDDAEAQGGFVMAAHPRSSRLGSRWTAGCAGLAGLEVVNLADPAAWPSGLGALPALLHYPLDPRGALLRALRPPREPLDLWDSCSAERPLAGWLGSDAHGGFPAGPLFVPVPSYRAILGLGSNHLLLPEPWNGDVAHDGALVWRALREGRGYAALDALADASRFRFEATSGGRRAGPGETLVLDGGTARLEAAATAPPGTTLVLVRNGAGGGARPANRAGRRRRACFASRPTSTRASSQADVPFPGSSRTRSRWPTRRMRARAERHAAHPPAPPAATIDVQDFANGTLGEHWQIDRARDAGTTLGVEAGALRWDFRLGGSRRTYASVADYRPRDLSSASGRRVPRARRRSASASTCRSA